MPGGCGVMTAAHGVIPDRPGGGGSEAVTGAPWMPRRSTLTLSQATVDALATDGREVIHWDRELAGFGVRVYPSGRKVYVVQTRAHGAPRRLTLGVHGALSAEHARSRAAAAIDRIKRGEDPRISQAQAETTVAALAARYMSGHVAVNCNAHTAGIYRGALDNHILPALGALPLDLVERSHVAALHYQLRETPRAANRALMILSKMFSLAAAWGLVEEGKNPCRAIRKYKERKRERFLSRDEYRRLGLILAAADEDGSASRGAIAALRLLMLTGCRLSEILTLKWDDVDRITGEFRLRESKTGARMVPLTPAAETVLEGIARVAGNPWVIVGKKPGGHLTTITPEWYRLRKRAGLEDVRIHDLRHSYASRALANGESLSMIGKLLGHADLQSTARYAHLARDQEKTAAEKVAVSIDADIMAASADAGPAGPVPLRPMRTAGERLRSEREDAP